MAHNTFSFFNPLWKAVGAPLATDLTEYHAILMVEGAETFEAEFDFQSDYVSMRPLDERKTGCMIGGSQDLLYMFLNINDDVCDGASWTELADKLPAGLRNYPELTETSFGWVQQLLNVVVGRESALQFRVI